MYLVSIYFIYYSGLIISVFHFDNEIKFCAQVIQCDFIFFISVFMSELVQNPSSKCTQNNQLLEFLKLKS